jgi:hypothetical protein
MGVYWMALCWPAFDDGFDLNALNPSTEPSVAVDG